MRIPVIGVTTYRFKNKSGYLQYAASQAYIQALSAAGACPALLPYDLGEGQLAAILSRLDGLLFTGGGDVNPSRYHSQEHPLVDGVENGRDVQEIELVHYALEKELPFFGICRGLQVINVALGGSLYEDILDQHPGAQQHQYYEKQPREYLAHRVRLAPEARLAGILDMTEPAVNSLHHQGIRSLAPGLKAVAHAEDGIIEAIELSSHPFGLAVQWHPENLQHLPEMRRLFRTFVQACSRFSTTGRFATLTPEHNQPASDSQHGSISGGAPLAGRLPVEPVDVD